MEKKPKVFQIVFIGVFIVMIIFGFLAFSGKLPLPKGKEEVSYGSVKIWGTLPQSVVQGVLAEKLGGQKSITITYTQKNADTFDAQFVEALASGAGPDLVILPQDKFVKSFNKLSLIPETAFSQRDFKNSFIEGGEIFLYPSGALALPIAIDPMVMYWNRDIFTNASLVSPPTKWLEFYNLAPKLTVGNRAGEITQSLVAFGEYQNITHAKDIIAMLLLQGGNAIVGTTQTGTFRVDINEANEGSAVPALNFFTEFARPDKSVYSWNRSLPDSRDMFTAGDLALYFGYASEYDDLKKRNPHLNFDVTLVPQADKATKRTTFGSISGIAVVKASKNPTGALVAIKTIAGRDISGAIATALGTPPVRRDLLTTRPGDAVASVFYDSAIIARSWRDPSPTQTSPIFGDMINSINSGRYKTSQALTVFKGALGNTLNQ